MGDRENVIPRVGDIYVLRSEHISLPLWRLILIVNVKSISLYEWCDATVDVTVVDHTGQIRTFRDISSAGSIWNYGMYTLVREER